MLSYQEAKRLSDPSNRKRDSQSHRDSDNEDESLLSVGNRDSESHDTEHELLLPSDGKRGSQSHRNYNEDELPLPSDRKGDSKSHPNSQSHRNSKSEYELLPPSDQKRDNETELLLPSEGQRYSQAQMNYKDDKLVLPSDRKRDSQSYLKSDKGYELLPEMPDEKQRLFPRSTLAAAEILRKVNSVLLPDHSIYGMPDKKPVDEEQQLFAGSTAATENPGDISVISLVDSFHLIN